MTPEQRRAMFANKNNFTKKNLTIVPKESGVYELYSKDGKLLYVGVATKGKYANLRHRLESYKEKDDFGTHPTKKELRPKIKEFSYAVIPISHARRIEKSTKGNTEFNKDHNIGTWKR